MISALIVDDEPYARAELAELLRELGGVTIQAEAGNALEAMGLLQQQQPDVMFLDIQMPKISGLELLSMVEPERLPRVVFVTAHDEYAIQAFEDNAFDYLLKPVSKSRLQKTLDRLREALPVQDLEPVTPPLTTIPGYQQQRIRLVPLADVEYIYSDLGGVHLVTPEGEYHTQLTLKVLEQRTPLLRVHRQYLMRVEAIREITLRENHSAELETRLGHRLPVSRRYLKALKSRLGLQQS
ncbi:two-component system response regulator BtsR [Zobellella maritima]|uniref:two-component system response regulator BtsR n=1 Tax=Zobellella maritima TaxID=2059725 RepID=UPI000E309A5B|nr:two-component system response regulator BtsR [Zobellella maritima]